MLRRSRSFGECVGEPSEETHPLQEESTSVRLPALHSTLAELHEGHPIIQRVADHRGSVCSMPSPYLKDTAISDELQAFPVFRSPHYLPGTRITVLLHRDEQALIGADAAHVHVQRLVS